MKSSVKLNVYSTKEQVAAAGLLDVKPYGTAASVYKAIHNGMFENIDVTHSDVFYVRAALEARTGFYFPLQRVEAAMKAEGWRDRAGKGRY